MRHHRHRPAPLHEVRDTTREPPNTKKVTTRVPDISPMWPMWRYIIVALAVVCLGMLGWYGATRYPGRIESDLASRAQKVLDSRVPGLVVKASERTLVLQGVVKDEAQRIEVERLASDLPGVKEVNSTLTVEAPALFEGPPTQKALLDLEIVWSGKAIELRGSLPKALQKDFDLHLVSSFGTEDVVVSRRIGQPEGEAPKEGKAQLEDAINALVQMSSGRARIAGGALAISGVVPSSEVEGRVMAIAAKAKAQVSLVVRAPTADPAPVADVVEPVPDTALTDVAPEVLDTVAEVSPDTTTDVQQADTGPLPTDTLAPADVAETVSAPSAGPLRGRPREDRRRLGAPPALPKRQGRHRGLSRRPRRPRQDQGAHRHARSRGLQASARPRHGEGPLQILRPRLPQHALREQA